MKFYVHYSTGCILDADSEESAQAQLCELIKNNIEPGLCEANECGGEVVSFLTARAPAADGHGSSNASGEGREV